MMKLLLAIAAALAAAPSCTAFAPVHHSVASARSVAPLQASPVDVLDLALSNVVGDGAMGSDIMAANMVATSSMILSETEEWVQPLSLVLGPFLNFFTIAMLCRIVLSWYPKANMNEFPFNLVVWPTEPLLKIVRGSIPPAFGVDITPVVWLGLFSFMNEIFLGQQGLLTMKMKYGI